MKLDLISSTPLRPGTINMDYHIGKLNGLLITNVDGFNDRITVKLRHDQDTEFLATRLRMSFVRFLTDLYHGNTGGGVIGKAVEFTLQTLAGGATPDPLAVEALSNYRGLTADVSAVYLPLGNINLEDKELEISIEVSEDSPNKKVDVSLVHLNDGPDIYLKYDETTDTDISMKGIRQIFLSNQSGLVNSDGSVQEIDIQLDITDGRNLLNNVNSFLGATSVFGGIEGYGSQQYCRIYEETLPVPAKIRTKLTGGGVSGTEIIFVRELVPDTVSESNLVNLEEIAQRVERLEREDPQVAKNYRRAGLTVKSEVLDQTAKALDK